MAYHQEIEPIQPPEPDSLNEAILQTVAYADVFDYPLTPDEVHRYLVGVQASLPMVQQALTNGQLPAKLARHDDFVMLRGREEIVAIRRERAKIAEYLWARAIRYGNIIAGLPFVRMVAITGSLAVDNAEQEGDIDYMVITAPDRLWLCRALVIALVRWAARQGDTVCPNYFLSERSLRIENPNLFVARELAQLVPLSGFDIYRQIRDINNWSREFLPNADGPPAKASGLNGHASKLLRRLQPAGEAILRTGLGEKLDRWEMNRKVRKFKAQYPNQSEAAFSVDWCKGHFDGHAGRIMHAFNDRLQTIDEAAA
ncbi:MAG: hypothetical protein J5I90_11445 [Caldilineales bacterium]|nr:hypothetical protein [Caldilineales bacterium]